ncbi:MAG: TetR family transcriptional regulator [Caulobacterales bacterium 32-69-10]|nr:MAG: TetR family transcriptional regulator [Caulobacterales bacterium 32-69-10]
MNQAVKLTARLEPYPEAVGAISRPRPAADSPKSLRTRARILDAAQRLFVEIGYASASNARIAEAAGLTRGAMLYHFPDRESLVEAVVPYIQAARTKLLQAAHDATPLGADRIDYAIDSYWRLLREPAFVAFAELEAAARTDAALAERLAPAAAAFDRADIGEHLIELVQGAEGPRFQASRDLARFMLEGLARSQLSYDADGRSERLLTVVKRAAHILNRKGLSQDLWPEG